MPKSVEQYYQELLDTFFASSGYLPHSSCDLSVRLLAVATQLHGLDCQAQWALGQCFPQTATGEYLDRHAQLRGIARSLAEPAAGSLQFGTSSPAVSPLSIPCGTVCMTRQGLRFATTADAVIPVGAVSVEVPARALSTGSAGNAAAGTITLIAALPTGIQSCVNPAPFTGGRDEESDDALRSRLLDSYHRLSTNANAAFYEQTALAIPHIAGVAVVPRPRGVGSVDLYITANEGLPSDQLLTQADAILQVEREIAVDLQVKAPTAAPVSIAVAIAPADGYSFDEAKSAAEGAIRGCFDGSLLGKGLTRAFFGNTLYGLDCVQNYSLSLPLADIPPQPLVLPVLQQLTVTPMEA